MGRVLSVFLASMAFAAPALAEPSPVTEEAQALSGKYLFALSDGTPSDCILELLTQGTYGEYDVTIGANCESQFGFLGSLSGWKPAGGGIKLIGAESDPMGDMMPNGNGGFAGIVPHDGQDYTLSPVD